MVWVGKGIWHSSIENEHTFNEYGDITFYSWNALLVKYSVGAEYIKKVIITFMLIRAYVISKALNFGNKFISKFSRHF